MATTKASAKPQTKSEGGAEKAYADVSEADASTQVKPSKSAGEDNPAVKKAPVRKAPAAKAAKAETQTAAKTPAKVSAKKAAPKNAAPKNAAPKKTAAKTPAKAAVKAAVKKSPAAKTEPSVTQLKEKIMATQASDYTSVMTDTMTDAMKEMQDRTQSAYNKSTEAMTEMTEFAKGNVEAAVESGKIFAEGVQSMGQTYADEAKSAYETVTSDLKDMASIKSPTELFQLQGKILRRNFDAMVATSSKNTDAAMKLANDAMAPISDRVNVAAEKLSKVA